VTCSKVFAPEGYEDGEGGHGTITFDLSTVKIRVEHNWYESSAIPPTLGRFESWPHPLDAREKQCAKFGGAAEDYLPIHEWFDESKAILADVRHRALRHHAEGIFFGRTDIRITIRNSQGKDVPVRYIGEQHVREDLGATEFSGLGNAN